MLSQSEWNVTEMLPLCYRNVTEGDYKPKCYKIKQETLGPLAL